MTQIQTIKEKPLADLYAAIEENKNNPSGIISSIMETLDEVMDGTVGFFDPTNPTVMLLESACVATAAAVNENINLLRWQYPSLAETQQQLYNHMSDIDFSNRFATPGCVDVSFLFSLSTLLDNMILDKNEGCKKAIIPRDTEVYFGDIPFTLQYPIVFRFFNTGTLEISYDPNEISPFQKLETNIIPYESRTKPDGVKFLHFQIPLWQLKIELLTGTVQSGRIFSIQTTFEDQFYYARAYIRNSSTGDVWSEIKTTHSDLVFDQRTPTVFLKVEENSLTALLPQIYNVSGSLLGEIKLHVYTTKGGLVENLETYKSSIEFRALDQDKDLTVYTTESFVSVPREAFTTATLTGGTDGLSFEKLRERVIFNTLGQQEIPITQVQLQAMTENKGFEIIKNVDVITNRIFLATQNLPKPSDPRLLTAANISIETFIVEKSVLENNPFVTINGDRWTLAPKNLFVLKNGIINILSYQEIKDLEVLDTGSKLSLLNKKKYLYTPFHWVLDNSLSEFSLRPYYLDKPSVSTIDFKRQNQSLQLAVNTASRWITKTTEGYKLFIQVLSGSYYKALSDSQVSAQIMFYPEGETLPVYIRGKQLQESNSLERIFYFSIETNHDIDEKHRICITSGEIKGQSKQNVWISLKTDFHLFLCTNSKTTIYKEDETNSLYGSFQLPEGSVPITHESLTVTFGLHLKSLWSRARNLTTGQEFQTYSEDVPLFYEDDVYKTDPVTGDIFSLDEKGKPIFTVLHKAGERALGYANTLLWKHRKGDLVIDPATNLPKPLTASLTKKELDLLFIDGRHYFVTDKVYLDYNQELVNILVTWITDDLASIEKVLLEKTNIFYYPKSQLGQCKVDRGDGFELLVESEQSPVVDLYVGSSVYDSEPVRSNIVNKVIASLDLSLSSGEINKSKIESYLKEVLQDSVVSLNLYGLGGDYNLHYAKLLGKEQRLTLKRILVAQSDNTLIMKEDVKVNFIKI